jgi:hypothetical protein
MTKSQFERDVLIEVNRILRQEETSAFKTGKSPQKIMDKIIDNATSYYLQVMKSALAHDLCADLLYHSQLEKIDKKLVSDAL